ncbi:undecaprenyldiphospho-muramoylpentapeptide beta-N-acetylglucosaminyltransferase [Sediminicola luteus]|uniref:UDP-N-acetylglucosamine--N-acetylmuramyl-(pentapeptide) pyrophosphoryl-undecaprenol N-acetylglucosamine transferase n=1 Tax=Sediminicola luteus TaxID=319238 RepID=A0A2A4G5X7_9FLAO|nr:undecaprenyldiphospho-muramoylpentapeptide beta-N-acetylglucosaminyltransferase [Sediminicola luteus]PCE63386.1 undecaprenyldiphospho-muramoylpentapeptide beta-N-acetylglucosaminyltransferase [Sediminicola luteus]
MGNYKFILSGGGTGGHIYPAIAIANELKRRHPQAEFLFVGASDRMEMEKVPQAGYPIKGLWISGLQRKLSLKNLLFPIKLVWSLIKASSIVARFKPNVVIGTGGFASGPLIKAASFLNVPSVLQEQNSYAGITNKWLAPAAFKICVAYDNMERYFPKDKIRLTGNPVRDLIISQHTPQEEARKHFGLAPNKKTLLILGGSLGAKRINQLISENLEFFDSLDIQLIWQCGKLYKTQYATLENDSVKVLDFITEMGQAYASADFVISRAGASSVSELCIVGKPVVFIPSPNVAEDHQTKNALALVDKKAAILVREKELETGFQPLFKNLVASEEQQTELSKNIKQLALPKATEHIVDEIEALLKK